MPPAHFWMEAQSLPTVLQAKSIAINPMSIWLSVGNTAYLFVIFACITLGHGE